MVVVFAFHVAHSVVLTLTTLLSWHYHQHVELGPEQRLELALVLQPVLVDSDLHFPMRPTKIAEIAALKINHPQNVCLTRLHVPIFLYILHMSDVEKRIVFCEISQFYDKDLLFLA